LGKAFKYLSLLAGDGDHAYEGGDLEGGIVHHPGKLRHSQCEFLVVPMEGSLRTRN
jgi:hypothetical protein